MNKSRKTAIQTYELSELRTITLGGYSQKIMIDGKYKNNPIVICLHGGPGSPVPFSEGCRGMFPEITEKLTLVCWDQLGCGINNHPIDDSFCIKNFTDMTADLIRETKRCFPENKLYLFGISWGSILAAYAAASPEADMLDGVFTYGQVICEMTFNSEVKKALEASKMPESKKKKLGAIMNERNIDNAKLIMSFIRKYTEGYVCKADKSAPIGSIIKGMLTSPDYCFKDFKAVAINGYMKNSSLMKELLEIDKVIALYEEDSDKYKEAVALKLKIVEMMEKELLLETLIKSRGFSDAVVSIGMNSDNVNVFINSNELDYNTAMQIYTMLKDEVGIAPGSIIILPVYSQV